MLRSSVIGKRRQQVLYDTKWQKFRRRGRLFKYLPFVEAAFGSGSLALGNVTETSDFDVLICARSGRIFTARFFAVVVFGLFGWRRSKLDHRESASDKICLNHFVTPASYRLRLPANSYWRLLYERLVPMYGRPDIIQQFFAANAALTKQLPSLEDQRYERLADSKFKRALEQMLTGKFGNWLENQLKAYQMKRIENGLNKQQTTNDKQHEIRIEGSGKRENIKLVSLIVYSDEELDFHPDPAQIIIE